MICIIAPDRAILLFSASSRQILIHRDAMPPAQKRLIQAIHQQPSPHIEFTIRAALAYAQQLPWTRLHKESIIKFLRRFFFFFYNIGCTRPSLGKHDREVSSKPIAVPIRTPDTLRFDAIIALHQYCFLITLHSAPHRSSIVEPHMLLLDHSPCQDDRQSCERPDDTVILCAGQMFKQT